MIAIQTGDIAKATLLRDHGANMRARGRFAEPPLFYAIENHHGAMLRWLLAIKIDSEQTDEFGTTGLITAVEVDDLEYVEILLAAGVMIERICNGNTGIGNVRSRPMVLRLLTAGADPSGLSNEGRRLLTGLKAEASEDPLEAVSPEEFQRAYTQRFRTANPERIQEPFWEAMIHAGVTGFAANEYFGALRS